MRRSLFAILFLVACGDDAASADTDVGTSSDGTTSSASGSSSDSSGTTAVEDDESSSSSTSAVDSTGTTGEPEPLEAIAGDDRYALVGDTVALDGSASTGAVLYQWTLDDGSRPAEPSDDPTLEISWDTPGRYRPVLTVFDADGNTRSEDVTITVTFEPTHEPEQSSTIDIDAQDRAIVVSQDSDELITVERSGDRFALGVRVPTCGRPRTVAWWVAGNAGPPPIDNRRGAA